MTYTRTYVRNQTASYAESNIFPHHSDVRACRICTIAGWKTSLVPCVVRRHFRWNVLIIIWNQPTTYTGFDLTICHEQKLKLGAREQLDSMRIFRECAECVVCDDVTTCERKSERTRTDGKRMNRTTTTTTTTRNRTGESHVMKWWFFRCCLYSTASIQHNRPPQVMSYSMMHTVLPPTHASWAWDGDRIDDHAKAI